ncbi:MAG TPA: TSUP family transporter, partial [Ramlibacter sp.]
SGLWGLRPRATAAAEALTLGVPAFAALGLLVGLGSALTGTGGPVLLVPLLMLARQPLRAALPAAQAIQLPVALCAGAGHAWAGALDLRVALPLGGVLLVGALAGQWAAPRTPAVALHRLVCALLILTGGWFAHRLLA